LLRCQKSLAYFTAALSGVAIVLETLTKWGRMTMDTAPLSH